ncbi:hypothetical protein GALMADRAFT_700672 [Galerina marginata CBS 339.88]|uniref:Uncharacterized protein n=1 Tax=Galerina marginata (strain CBS 339.88) TaxID=685588 RepID=A0A067TP89_GALM3|nr:hypothetical protein GALMADRAFT_700672 [Galerina marginata CBS 339.88]
MFWLSVSPQQHCENRANRRPSSLSVRFVSRISWRESGLFLKITLGCALNLVAPTLFVVVPGSSVKAPREALSK